MKVARQINLAGKGPPWDVGAERQRATAQLLLDRFSAGSRVQLLADDVGMGKTYVALTVAVSLLLGRRASNGKRTGRVLILAPNQLLEEKWVREIAEFQGRLLSPAASAHLAVVGRAAGDRSSRTTVADLATATKGLELVVGRYGTQGTLTSKLGYERWHRGHAARALERHLDIHGWRGWLRAESRIDCEHAWLTQSIAAMRNDARPVLHGGRVRTGRELWAYAEREMRQHPYGKDRGWMRPVLNDLARAGYLRRIQPVDLVIVDEVHNWQHGKNGMRAIQNIVFPHCQHGLAMTATPLQLDSSTFVEILRPFEHLHDFGPAGGSAAWPSLDRLGTALKAADDGATTFRREWQILDRAPELDPDRLPDLAAEHPFRQAALALNRVNRDLEEALVPWFTRHRRPRLHRWVYVGEDMPNHLPTAKPPTQEPHQLHIADGFASDRAEVAQLALMRLGAIAIEHAGKPTLAASMTGCFSTIEATARDAAAIRHAVDPVGARSASHTSATSGRSPRPRRQNESHFTRNLSAPSNSWKTLGSKAKRCSCSACGARRLKCCMR